MLLQMIWWISITFRDVVLIVWFFKLPLWIWCETASSIDWRKDREKYPCRRLQYCIALPPIQLAKVSIEDYRKESERVYPEVIATFKSPLLFCDRPWLTRDVLVSTVQTLLERDSHWEGFPGFGWSTVMKK
jgi:hypothetical protein